MKVVPRLLARNWRLKLAALGLAIFLWAVVGTRPNSTSVVIPARVQVDMSASPGWTTARPPDPATVNVHVQGSFDDLQRIQRGGLVVRVPLERVAGGDTVVTLRPAWAPVDGATVERIEPAQVSLAFAPSDSAAKPLSIRTTGSLPGGKALAQPLQLTPGVVRIRGPANLVSAVDSIPILPLDLSRFSESGMFEAPLDTAAFPGITFATTRPTVTVRLEDAVERVFGAVPVVFSDIPDGIPTDRMSLDPPLVEVTLQGGRTRVEQASAPDLRAVVAGVFVESMEPGESRVVPLRLGGVPPLVSARANPDSVRVRWRGAGGGQGEGGGHPPGGGP